MNDPFTPPPGGFGFGFGPQQRRALHEQRRQARREFREHLREHGTGQHGPFGPGFQAGFNFGPGRGGFGFDPRGGFGFGGGPRGRRGGGRRGKRGDVRAAILTLLSDRPMHGYEMIQEISERSGGLWRPSPGSVYPTLQLLVDEGLIVGTESEGSKRLFELTEEGRAAAEKVETPPWEEIAEGWIRPRPRQPAYRARPAGGCGGAVRLHRDRGAAAAHRRHHQRCPPRGVQHPRRNRVVRIQTE